MEKVKLPREVSEAIEKLREVGYVEYDFACIVTAPDKVRVEARLDDAQATICNWYNVTGGMRTYMQALINGYEVEQTPEDKVRDYYNIAKSDMQSMDYDLNFPGRERVEAISYVLEALGIKIEGVNA